MKGEVAAQVLGEPTALLRRGSSVSLPGLDDLNQISRVVNELDESRFGEPSRQRQLMIVDKLAYSCSRGTTIGIFPSPRVTMIEPTPACVMTVSAR